jgi:hypothetical protein
MRNLKDKWHTDCTETADLCMPEEQMDTEQQRKAANSVARFVRQWTVIRHAEAFSYRRLRAACTRLPRLPIATGYGHGAPDGH